MNDKEKLEQIYESLNVKINESRREVDEVIQILFKNLDLKNIKFSKKELKLLKKFGVTIE